MDFGKEGGVRLSVSPLVSSSLTVTCATGEGSGKKACLAGQDFPQVDRSPVSMNGCALFFEKAIIVYFRTILFSSE